jgi:hypothetical protein
VAVCGVVLIQESNSCGEGGAALSSRLLQLVGVSSPAQTAVGLVGHGVHPRPRPGLVLSADVPVLLLLLLPSPLLRPRRTSSWMSSWPRRSGACSRTELQDGARSSNTRAVTGVRPEGVAEVLDKHHHCRTCRALITNLAVTSQPAVPPATQPAVCVCSTPGGQCGFSACFLWHS